MRTAGEEKRERRMTERTGGERERGRGRVPQTAGVYGKCIPLFPFLYSRPPPPPSLSLSAREIDFPLILPRPRTRPHSPISPGDAMNKKFTESRARCSNTARRPMSIYGIRERKRERRKRERKRENEITGDFVRIGVTWILARCLRLDRFYITERLKREFNSRPVNRVPRIESVCEDSADTSVELSKNSFI